MPVMENRLLFQEEMGQSQMVKLDSHLNSNSQSKYDAGEQNQRSNSVFGIPGLFVGLNSRVSSDADSVRSPTSPLDLMLFSRLGAAAGSPRDRSQQKSWDCIKLGLSIVDSLEDNERNLSDGTLRSSYSKSIIFGPKLKLKDPTISIPRAHNGSSLRSSNSSIAFEIGGAQFTAELGEKVLSCSLDSCFVMNYLPKSIKKSPRPDSLNTGEGSECCLPAGASDIELSEDYTCVISHGPGTSKTTTHIYGDCTLECRPSDGASMDVAKQVEEGNPGLYVFDDFLRLCYTCKKFLEDGKDIYIYRGDKAFCSEECRMKEISLEGDPEEILKDFGNSPTHGRGDGHF